MIEITESHFVGYMRRNRLALGALLYTFCLRLTDAKHRVEVFAHRGAEQRRGRLMLRHGMSGARNGRVDREKLTVYLGRIVRGE